MADRHSNVIDYRTSQPTSPNLPEVKGGSVKHEHHTSMATYIAIFLALMVLLGVTWGMYYVDLGRFNTLIALVVAVTKAVLVILFFMHVRDSTRLTWVTAAAGFCWLAIMVALMFPDYLTRRVVPAAMPSQAQSLHANPVALPHD